MKGAEWVGLDTNVLVYADDPASAHHEKAKAILEEALKGGRQVCLSPQVLAEYFSVVTSAQRTKQPLSPREARERVLFLNRTRRIRKIFPKRSTLKRCVELCAQHDIRGPRIFDALYAVTLLDHHVGELLTQNVRDFRSFHPLKATNPFAQT